MTPGDGYLEAIVKDNVECIFQGIDKVVSEGLITSDDKQLHEIDILVCATGFDAPYFPQFGLINGRGISIHDSWKKEPNLYMSIAAPEYPNYFITIGPGGTWSNGTILPGLETCCEHFIKIFNKMQNDGIKSIEVSQEACNDFLYHMDKYHEDTVFGGDCRSRWEKIGRVWLWPGATINFLKTIKDGPRYEDYHITYWKGRRFAYLGDGSVKAMRDGNIEKLTPYIRTADTLWEIN